MSEDDLMHLRRVKKEREPEEKKERVGFRKSNVGLMLMTFSAGLLFLLNRNSRGHDL